MLIKSSLDLNKQQQLQNVASNSSFQNEGQGSSDLFDQFSAILDKIASRLEAEHTVSHNFIPQLENIQPIENKEKITELVEKAQVQLETAPPQKEKPKEIFQKERVKEEEQVEEAPVVEQKAVEELRPEPASKQDPAEAQDQQVLAQSVVAASHGIKEHIVSSTQQSSGRTVDVPQQLRVGQEGQGKETNTDSSEWKPFEANRPIVDSKAQVLSEKVQKLSNQNSEVIEKVVSQELQNEPIQLSPKELAQVKVQVEQIVRAAEAPDKNNLASKIAEAVLQELNSRNLLAAQSGQQEIMHRLRDSILASIMTRQMIDVRSAGQGIDTNIQLNSSPTQSLTPFSATDQSKRGSFVTDERGEQTQKLPRSYEARTLEKVEEVLKEVAKSKDGKTLSFRLDPPQLGQLKVDVSLRDGTLHARLVAENPLITALLRDKAADLQRSLRELGIDVDQITVAVPEQETGFFQGQSEFEKTFDGKQESEQQGRLQIEREQAVNAHNHSGMTPGKTSVDDHWVA